MYIDNNEYDQMFSELGRTKVKLAQVDSLLDSLFRDYRVLKDENDVLKVELDKYKNALTLGAQNIYAKYKHFELHGVNYFLTKENEEEYIRVLVKDLLILANKKEAEEIVH